MEEYLANFQETLFQHKLKNAEPAICTMKLAATDANSGKVELHLGGYKIRYSSVLATNCTN